VHLQRGRGATVRLMHRSVVASKGKFDLLGRSRILVPKVGQRFQRPGDMFSQTAVVQMT